MVIAMAQGNFKKSGGAPKMKGKAGRGNVAAKSRRLVNKGKTAVKKGCEWLCCVGDGVVGFCVLGLWWTWFSFPPIRVRASGTCCCCVTTQSPLNVFSVIASVTAGPSPTPTAVVGRPHQTESRACVVMEQVSTTAFSCCESVN